MLVGSWWYTDTRDPLEDWSKLSGLEAEVSWGSSFAGLEVLTTCGAEEELRKTEAN